MGVDQLARPMPLANEQCAALCLDAHARDMGTLTGFFKRRLPPFKKSSIKQKYNIGEQIGAGTFSVVKKATRKGVVDGGPKEVAIKIVSKSKTVDVNDIQREISILSMVDSPNVLKLYEIHDEPKKMYLVMELLTGGELYDRILARGSYTEKDAADTIFTLCNALAHLHERKIVHRDLKPENILYDTPEPNATMKIADFGLARKISGDDLMRTMCGTPAYAAPEVVRDEGYDSAAPDVWSAGVILYVLLFGFPPFPATELPALFDQILHARCAANATSPDPREAQWSSRPYTVSECWMPMLLSKALPADRIRYDFPSPWCDEVSEVHPAPIPSRLRRIALRTQWLASKDAVACVQGCEER